MISNKRNCVIEFDEIKRKYKKNKHFRKKNERIKPKPQMKSKHALIISGVLIKRPSLSTKVTSRLMSWYKRMNNNRKKARARHSQSYKRKENYKQRGESKRKATKRKQQRNLNKKKNQCKIMEFMFRVGVYCMKNYGQVELLANYISAT